MNTRIRINNYTWVLYPVLVAVFIIMGANFILNSGKDTLLKFTERKSEIEEFNLRANNLRSTLEILKGVDVPTTREQLGLMLKAVPASRQVWLLISELNQAAVKSGMSIDSYKGSIGDIQEATKSADAVATPEAELTEPSAMILKVVFENEDFSQLAFGLGELERLIPLVKIVRIDYGINSAEITVEGAWSAWEASSNNPELVLPDYRSDVLKVTTLLERFEPVGITPTETGASTSGLPQPNL